MVGWYKRDPSAALEGMQRLTLEERGAYNTILDLIYLRDDRLADDDHFISGYLGVDKRVWKRVKASLVAKGKLVLDGEFIRNGRATTEVAKWVATSVANRVAGQHSALVRADKSEAKVNKINELNGTGAQRALNDKENKKENKKESKRTPPIVPPFALPEWVPQAAWDGWIEARKKQRAMPTGRAMMLAIKDLEKYRKAGHDPGKLLDLATLNNWKGIYPGRDGATLANGKAGMGTA